MTLSTLVTFFFSRDSDRRIAFSFFIGGVGRLKYMQASYIEQGHNCLNQRPLFDAARQHYFAAAAAALDEQGISMDQAGGSQSYKTTYIHFWLKFNEIS